MDDVKRWLPFALVVLFTAFVAGAFFYTHDREMKEVEVGPSGLASVNPWLAAERTLTELGVPTTSTYGLVELPPQDHLIVVLDRTGAMREPMADDLLEWVDYGGTLVYVTPDSPDTLATAETWGDTEHLWGEARWYGAGVLVEMESAAWMRSKHLPEGDNASRLLAGAWDHEGALFIIRGESPGIFTLLWRHAWMLCFSVLVLGLAWIRAVSGRFGPRVPDPVPTRRSLLEHVLAAGRFLARHGHQEELVDSARRATLERLEVRIPGLGEVASEAQAELVSARTQVPKAEVMQALSGPARSRRQFTRTMNQLQRIWQKT